MEVAVVGLGLMGGSLSLSLQQEGKDYHFIGVDNNEQHCVTAQALGILNILPELLDRVKPGQVIIDFGSTKALICQQVNTHINRSQYVAAHPMAGTENTGPEAAFAELYKGCINILCETALSGKEALNVARCLFEDLGMTVIEMEAADHDKHVAYISHLSHVSSFMLGRTVLDIEKDEKSIFNLAGSGFQSTVRLAMSSPDMWGPIFFQNAQHISLALEEYIRHLQEFKSKIDSNDRSSLLKLMKEANDIRRVLKKKD